MHWAASGGHDAVLEFLLSKGAAVNAVDDVSDTIAERGVKKEA